MAVSNITMELITDLMETIKPGTSVSSFEVKTGSQRGDNYTAMLFRVVVNLSDDTQESLIVKCLPDSIVRRQAFKSDVLFQNEVAFYTQVLPALLSFQEKNNRGDGKISKFCSVPKCHLAKDDLIVLEDLKVRGFDMSDRKTGLNEEQCVAVLRVLAEFHSLSLAMKHKQPARFQKLVIESVDEVFFTLDNKERYRDYYKTASENALAMVKERLLSTDTNEYIERFRDFLEEESFFGSMVESVKPREPFSVLCHGDCWSNNILFKYDENGSVDEICLVDFQVARYCSPAMDIVHLLYCCTSHELRKESMNYLIDEYCSTMTTNLLQLGCLESLDICKTETLKEILIEEIHICGKFGLGLAIDMIPICTCDSDQAPDLYVDPSQEENETNVTHQLVQPVSTFNEQCSKKLSELVLELVDNGDL